MKRLLTVFMVFGLMVGSVTTSKATERATRGDRGSSLPSVTKLIASDGAAADLFGIAVAVSGNTAVVGAPQKAAPSPVEGAAYVFVRTKGAWTEQARLVPSDGAIADRFGQTVAISGNTVVVGAFWHDEGVNPDQGAAYVFTRSGQTWTEQAKLVASDGRAEDQFGFSVAISGDTVVVGAATQSTINDNPNEGAAYVFTRSGATWMEQAKLTAPTADGSHFGERVAISDDTAVVGAPEDEADGADGVGAAYVFTRDGQTWAPQAKLIARDGTTGDAFGFWVSVSGDTAAVGAFTDDVGTNQDQGSAYVFTRDDQTWTETAHLTASDGASGDAFARSVQISRDTLVVGAQYDEVDGTSQGSAYVFIRSDGIWDEQPRLAAADGAERDTYGASVGVSGDIVIAGAGFAQIGSSPAQGAAYTYVFGRRQGVKGRVVARQ